MTKIEGGISKKRIVAGGLLVAASLFPLTGGAYDVDFEDAPLGMTWGEIPNYYPGIEMRGSVGAPPDIPFVTDALHLTGLKPIPEGSGEFTTLSGHVLKQPADGSGLVNLKFDKPVKGIFFKLAHMPAVGSEPNWYGFVCFDAGGNHMADGSLGGGGVLQPGGYFEGQYGVDDVFGGYGFGAGCSEMWIWQESRATTPRPDSVANSSASYDGPLDTFAMDDIVLIHSDDSTTSIDFEQMAVGEGPTDIGGQYPGVEMVDRAGVSVVDAGVGVAWEDLYVRGWGFKHLSTEGLYKSTLGLFTLVFDTPQKSLDMDMLSFRNEGFAWVCLMDGQNILQGVANNIGTVPDYSPVQDAYYFQGGDAAYIIPISIDLGDSGQGCDEVVFMDKDAQYGDGKNYVHQWEFALDNLHTVGLDGDANAVVVLPPDNPEEPVQVEVPLSGGGVVMIEMTGVTTGGGVSVTTTASANPDNPLPGDFELFGQTFEVTATSDFTSIQLCFPYTDEQLAAAGIAEEDLVILHGVEGVWIEEETTVYPEDNLACTTVSSLSPFVLAARNGGPLGNPVPALPLSALLLLSALLGGLGMRRMRYPGK